MLSQINAIFGKSHGSDRVPTQPPFNPGSCHTRLHPVTASAMSEPRAVATGSPPNTHSTLGPATLARCQPTTLRSEERRVGKECRSRCSPYHYKKTDQQHSPAINPPRYGV